MGFFNVLMIMVSNFFLSFLSRFKTKGVREMEISMVVGIFNIVMMFIKY